MILDVVEAHVRSGHGDDATMIAAHAADNTSDNHPLRLRFLVSAATALTATGDKAQERFVDALALDGIDRWPFEQARVEYLYGQWLRRHFANVEARRHLTRARDLFEILGADPWSRRVGHELRAAGLRGNGSNWPAEPLASELTPQESEVAALAAAGLSNKDIAARLFISPRTVSGHLYRIFPKLNVVSRAGLRDALATRNGLESADGPLSQPNKVI
jgi:DNA-binding CsgD family transcriptional regulator